MVRQDMPPNVFALVTVYYPGEQVVENMARIARQVTGMLIADNTPGVDNARLFLSVSNAVYIPNGENLGLSMAFNKLLTAREFVPSDFIMFFDQDAEVPENLVEVLIREYQRAVSFGFRVGCIGPSIYETSLAREMPAKRRTMILDTLYQTPMIITSSMLTTFGNMREAGFWNENIFLDYADFDLCFRFNKSGFICCISKELTLRHRLGNSVVQVNNYYIIKNNPVRDYYQIRDGCKVMSYSYTPLWYKLNSLKRLLFTCTLNLFFCDRKSAHVKYLFCGLIDFFRGRNGAYISQRERK